MDIIQGNVYFNENLLLLCSMKCIL